MAREHRFEEEREIMTWNPNNQGCSFKGDRENTIKASNVGQSSKGDIDPKLVLQCYGKGLDREDFSDFTVMVEGKQFKCHRFVLSACSDFFQSLLRADMSEKNSGKATLEGTSSEAFKLILDVIYRGQNILTKENITLIWQAANHLQISFLTEACEDFAIANMSSEDILPIHQMATFLDSKKVLRATQDMMAQKFKDIVHHDLFLQLPFNDFYEVLKKYMGQDEPSEFTHQNAGRKDFDAYDRLLFYKGAHKTKRQGPKPVRQLKANNTAINASMFWITGNPEYRVNIAGTVFDPKTTKQAFRIDTSVRTKRLKVLLEAAGISSATTDCIKRLLKDEIVMTNKEVRDLVLTVSMQRMS